MQEGPSSTLTDNAVANISHVPHVPSQTTNDNIVSIYLVRESEPDVVTRPFVHAVELKGERQIPVKIKGLFDDGALVNAICKTTFPSLKGVLGEPTPSTRTLQMADGAHVPSSG